METEFGFAARDEAGRRIDDRALTQLLKLVAQRVGNISSASSGLFLQNGGLLYIDSGGHPEWATPESTTPAELVAYVRAGESLLAGVAAELEKRTQYSEVSVFKCNVDYVDKRVTWGCHESYLCRHWHPSFPHQIIPFLASRIVYTGSGGLNNRFSGIEFSLSPRVAHLQYPISDDSTGSRAIYHTKDENLCDGSYHRMHLICGDSTCSQFQTYLKMGATMLVVRLIDAGKLPGDGVQLKNPVKAMQIFSADPECKAAVELEDPANRKATAIQIQRHYLNRVEQHLDAAFMPPWAEEICHAWRETLDQLESDPAPLWKKLDWVLKRKLFDARIHDNPVFSTDAIMAWNGAIAEIDGCLEQLELHYGRLTRAVIEKFSVATPLSSVLAHQKSKLAELGLSFEDIDKFLRLRYELCEFDTRFGELGERGIFESLDAAGILDHRVVPEDDCVRAITEPPTAGRARIRGEFIRQVSEDRSRRFCGYWQKVVGPDVYLDLGDPFEKEHRFRGSDGRPARSAETPPPPEDRGTGRSQQASFEFPDIPAFLRRRAE